jgi:hypothetical protein
MLGFYEEMADLAAMSEDDGFLGRCASSEIEKVMPEDQNASSSLPITDLLRRRPLQLKLTTTLSGTLSGKDTNA